MPRTVVALFDDAGTARRAKQTLELADLAPDHVLLTSSDPRTALAGDGVPVAERGEGPMTEPDVVARLVGHGVPEERARFCAGAVRRNGATVVLLDLDEERAERAAEILLAHRPVDPTRRLSAHHQAGYAGYNPAASPFPPDEAAAERNRFADEHHGDVDVIYVM